MRVFELQLRDLSSRQLALCALHGENGSVFQGGEKKASLVMWCQLFVGD